VHLLGTFNVFRYEDDGNVLWLGVAKSLDEANQKVAAAMHQVSCRYLIVDLFTGHRQMIQPNVAAPTDAKPAERDPETGGHSPH
jgi:hypothetical protein